MAFSGNPSFELATAAVVSPLTAFTLNIWIDKLQSSNKSSDQNLYYEYTDGGNYVRIYRPAWSPTVRCYYSRAYSSAQLFLTGLNDDSPHMITFVRHAANDWEAFIDGSSFATDNDNLGSWTCANYCKIGTSWTGTSQAAEASLLSAWNTDLSDDEIALLYALGNKNAYAAMSVRPGAMLNHWPMSEGSGAKILDVVGGNHGTAPGSVTWITKASFPVGPILINAAAGGAPPATTNPWWHYNQLARAQ